MKKINLFSAALGTLTAATCLVPLASTGCSKKFTITLDTTSSEGVKIESSNLKLNEDSTINVSLPSGYVIDKVNAVIASKFVEGISFKGNVITIPGKAVSGYKVLLKVTTSGEKLISETEWQEAVANVCNITSDRNYTMKVTQTYSGDGYSKKLEWDKYVTDYKVNGLTNQIDSQRINKVPGKDPTEGAVTRTFNTKYENSFWNVKTDIKHTEYEKVKLISESSFDNEGNFPVWFGLLYDQYNSFSYDPKNQAYYMVVYDYDNTKQTITLTFDNNKRISSYGMYNYVKAITGEESIYQDDIEISSYGDTTTEFDSDKFVTKLKESTTEIDASATSPKTSQDVGADTQYIYHLTYNDPTSANTWKYFTIRYFYLDKNISVFRNGEELTQGVDYTINRIGGLVEYGFYLSFTKEITSADDIYVCVLCESSKSGANIELTNTIPS